MICCGWMKKGLLGAACAVVASCASYEESGLPGSASWIARDKIMAVKNPPPSFGYHRLKMHVARNSDLGIFVNARGVPDFMAESKNRGRHYLILYYSKSRQAFACREGGEFGQTLEFSGPYPITEKEHRTLQQLRAH